MTDPGSPTQPDVDRFDVDVHPARAEQHERALAAGFVPTRELLQLRCTLPRPEPWSLSVRPFRPGTADETDWLAVNNRAFAWHPDQGGWTIDTLHAKMAEPWFRADGFLLHHDADGLLDGFCWTKVHGPEGVDPALGEIFVIGVDPRAHGRGLGRQLTLAGLSWLADQGLGTGMLYVESTNEPALAVYRGLGFAEDHRHVWYVRSQSPP